MIPTSSWKPNLNTTASYTYFDASLPTPYVAKIYDRANSVSGVSAPEIINITRTLGTPSDELRVTNGVYATIQLNNAYDVILLDTIRNIINDPLPTTTTTTTTVPPFTTDGLLIYLDASSPSSYPGSGTTWFDLSGNTNHFTLTNGPTYSTDSGGAIVLDGSNDSIDRTGLDWRRDFTFELWVNFSSLSGQRGLFGQGIAATNQAIYIAQNSNTQMLYRMYFNDFDLSLSTSTNTWYQYVFTYNHSSPFQKQIYRNGVLVGQSTSGQAQYAGTGVFRIGQTYSSGVSVPMAGSVGLFRAYTKILSAPEVLQNYNNNRSRFGL